MSVQCLRPCVCSVISIISHAGHQCIRRHSSKFRTQRSHDPILINSKSEPEHFLQHAVRQIKINCLCDAGTCSVELPLETPFGHIKCNYFRHRCMPLVHLSYHRRYQTSETLILLLRNLFGVLGRSTPAEGRISVVVIWTPLFSFRSNVGVLMRTGWGTKSLGRSSMLSREALSLCSCTFRKGLFSKSGELGAVIGE